MNLVEQFFAEIDSKWPTSDTKQQLRIIGSGALMLQTTYQRGTNDGDIFETQLPAEAKDRLLELAGRGTVIHAKRSMYVDIVANGIPFLPRPATWHAVPKLSSLLSRLEILALDVIDVVVCKLKPFRPRDIGDIAAMIDRGLVRHELLVERFKSAADEFAYGAYAQAIPTYLKNLNQVERDLFGVAESEIELPSWI